MQSKLELMAIEAAQVDFEEGTGADFFFYSVVEKYRPSRTITGKCHFCMGEGHFWMKCPKLRHILAENRLGRKWNQFTDRYERKGQATRPGQTSAPVQRTAPPVQGRQSAPNFPGT